MLDATDHQILSLLSTNGRASFASIGAEVGLSPHGTADRVRRLEREGVITGFTAVLDPAKTGRALDALIDVRLLPSTDPAEFEDFVTGLSAVTEMTFLTGRSDFQLRVACRDTDELNKMIRRIRRDAGAAATETRIVMRSAAFERGL